MAKVSKTTLVSRIADDMWNRGDIDVGDELMDPEAKYHGPHMPRGVGSREDWKRAITRYRAQCIGRLSPIPGSPMKI